MKLGPDERDLRGKWELRGQQALGDATSRRIKWLINTQLVELGADPTGWDVLYRDPGDGRLWELTYPQSDSHGGGPPRLTNIDPTSATKKYGNIDLTR
jgi:hypothetical protein